MRRDIIITIALAVFASLVLSSCTKDELHNTPHPDSGAVKVTTDWSALSEDATQPDSYLLRVGELTHSVSGATNAFNTLLSEGKHTLLVQNTPHGVTVDNTTATVNTLTDGTLEPLPDYLFSAKSDLQVVKDDTLRVNVKMIQSLRTLQLTLSLKEGDEERMASTDATLTGIASVIDLATGTAQVTDAGKTVKPSFQFGTANAARAATTPALITTLRLAGVSSAEKQILTLVVTLKDGSVQTIATDITQWLKNFTDKREPLTLDAKLELKDNAQTEIEVGGSIKDWDVVDNGNFPIH